MSVYYCESCLTGENKYIDSGNLPIVLPGQPDFGFNVGSGFNGYVYNIELQSDGKILVGGYFDEYSGTSVGYSLIRLESDGTIDTTFDVGSGFYNASFGDLGYINSIQIQSDGKILVGGTFDEYNGASVGFGLIRLESDGTIDTTFDVGTGFNNDGVYSIELQSDGKILVGGVFDEYNGTSVGSNLIRLESDGTIDVTFDVGSGFNSQVNTITLQSDGKILVGGGFDEYNGNSVGNSLIRLESDGTIDTTFDVGSGFNDFVYSTELQSDGKILVGGDFTSYSGVSGDRIIRLNTNGSIDTSFVIGIGFNGTVNTIALQSDGKIFVGGNFTSYSGVSKNGIVRLNTNGSIDTSFVIGIGFNGTVNTIALQPDGKILVGGVFRSYNGYFSGNICQIDPTLVNDPIIYATDFRCYDPLLENFGNLNQTFNIGTGFSFYVYSIVLQSDGKILVGGDFITYSGVSRNRIVRLNEDYSIDDSFIIGTGFNGIVLTIALQSDGKILVGGNFTSYSGVSSNRIIRLNTDGSVDTGFVIGTGFNDAVQSIDVQSDGKILVGGAFTEYSGVSSNYIIRLNTDGSVDTSFVIGTGFSSGGATVYVRSVTLQSDGKILVGGFFTSYSGVSRNRIIRLNTNGSVDTGFVIGVGFNSATNSIQLQSDGKIIVGGEFTSYNEYLAGGLNVNFTPDTISSIVNASIKESNNDILFGYGNRIRKVDSIVGSTIYESILNGSVNSLEELSDNSILVGGQFTSYNDVVTYDLIKINGSGYQDNSFTIGEGLGGTVLTTKELSDGKILVGGTITSYGDTQVYRLFSGGFNGTVADMVEQSNGKFIVSGTFTEYSGIPYNRIVRLNDDGSIDNSFVIGNGFNSSSSARVITLQSDGKILVTGTFTSYSGVSRNRIIRLNTDGSIDDSFVIGSGFNDVVSTYSTVIQPDGKILVGGSFTSYSGVSSNRIIRLNTNGSIDNTFGIGTGFSNTVRSITLQSDGKILVGGDFTSYSGVSRNNIIRLNTDGSIDSSFVIGTGFNNSVYVITLQPDGKILVGGFFLSYSGVSRNNFIRLNTDGSIDNSFVTGTGFNSFVYSIQLRSDGKILVGGQYTTYNSMVSNRATLLNSDGTINTSFMMTGSTAGANINAVFKILPKSEFAFICGSFTAYNNISQLSLTKISYSAGTSVNFSGYTRLNSNGSLDLTVPVSVGFNGTVNKIDTQPDGKILVGGAFTLYNGVLIDKIVRLNTDNTLDNTFNTLGRFNGNVNSFDIQTDGKIIVGGSFTSLLANVGVGFVGTGGTTTVYSNILQPDGKILVGGDFITYSGLSTNRIFRLNAIDYSIDTSFTFGSGFDNVVFAMDLQSDGKILVGGDFTSYSGVSRNRFIRLNTNGSIDTSFVIGTGFNGTVQSIEIQSDGKILVGGNYSSYSGVSRNKIIRLNTDGSIDNTFVIGTGFDGSSINAITLQTDGKILVGGNYTLYSGVSRTRIVRLNTNGSIDTGFVVGTGFGGLSTARVDTIKLQPDGKILVGGGFTSYNGATRNRIIRLNTNGSEDTGFVIGTGFGGIVYDINIQSNGSIIAVGLFTTYSAVTSSRVIVLNNNGSILTTSFGTGFPGGASPRTITQLPNGNILITGSFFTYNGNISQNLIILTTTLQPGQVLGRITRLNSNGTVDLTFSANTGFNGVVTDVSVQPDNKVFVSGGFLSYSGITSNRFARLNSDGTYDTTFDVGFGFSTSATTITQVSSEYVLVGGNFTLYNGRPTTRLVQLNSQSNTGATANGIIRLNNNGLTDTSFVTGDGFKVAEPNGSAVVWSTFIQPNGKILVGGSFASYNSLPCGNFTTLESDGSIDETFDIGSGFNSSSVLAITTQSDGNILVGGEFTYVGNLFAPYFVEILSTPIQGEYTAIELFSDCETCDGYVIPKSANTEYIECLICEGDALLVDAPHPVWTGLNGGAVTQLDAVTIGGNGWNS